MMTKPALFYTGEQRYPAPIASVKDVGAVASVVNFARDNNISLAVRSAGGGVGYLVRK